MDALVIQITLWRDDRDVRARVWSDATGETVDRIAGSGEEVLELVRHEIAVWTQATDGDHAS